MGLDICVRKIIKTPRNEYDYFRLLDDEGNYNNSDFPEWTKPLEHEITEDWFDWEKYKEETGIDIKQCEWHGESYGKDGNFMTLRPKSAGKYPEPSDFKNEEGSYDWDKYKMAKAEYEIQVDLDKVPTYKKTIKVLYWKEVGYKRKGLNKQFYDDYEAGKIGFFVWTKAELERYKQDYCDEPYEYVYPNGEKSGEIIHPKENFQKNIIDKFTEGEDCVIFSW